MQLRARRAEAGSWQLAAIIAHARSSLPLLLAAPNCWQRRDFAFDVIPADVDETHVAGGASRRLRPARRACEGGSRASSSRSPADVVLSADTVVVGGGRLMGKPADEADAVSMLRALSGETHEVLHRGGGAGPSSDARGAGDDAGQVSALDRRRDRLVRRLRRAEGRRAPTGFRAGRRGSSTGLTAPGRMSSGCRSRPSTGC